MGSCLGRRTIGTGSVGRMVVKKVWDCDFVIAIVHPYWVKRLRNPRYVSLRRPQGRDQDALLAQKEGHLE